MNGERMQVMLIAVRTQAGDLFGVRSLGAPHARAGGEDLESVGAEFGGLEGGAFERARRGAMDADSQEIG